MSRVASRFDRYAVTPLVLRGLMLVAPLGAVVGTWIAVGEAVPMVALLVLVLSVQCVRRPDSHVGLAVVLLVGFDWVRAMEARTSPWAIAVAAGLAVFHASMAAAAATPIAAPWTPAMAARWVRRTASVIVASAAVWVLVAVVDGRRPLRAAVIVVAALVVLAAGALWVRTATFVADRTVGRG